MAYVTTEDFRNGMDRRRPRAVGVPGTLYLMQNAHLTRGADIEKRKKFVTSKALPAGTFGLAEVNGQLHTFGSGASPGGLPIGIIYQRLQHPSSANMTGIMAWDSFDGKIYAIAEYDDGAIHHYYNGARVTEWDTVAGNVATDFTAVAERMARLINRQGAVRARVYGSTLEITALTPGTAFTISKSTTDGGSNNDQDITLVQAQANVAAVAEVQATADIEITGGAEEDDEHQISALTVNAVSLISSALDWQTSNETTALRLAQEINNKTADSGYSADVSGAVVTITAPPDTGATVNGHAVAVTTTGDVTVTADATVTGGVTAVEAVAQVYTAAFSGTFQTADSFTITLNGTAYKTTALAAGMGTSVFIQKNRVWSTARSQWRYCKLNDATVWSTLASSATDPGFVNMSSQSGGNETLLTTTDYQGYAAVFSANTIRLWSTDTDPSNLEDFQPLRNTGTVAPRSVVPYANNDVFYLSVSGIRTLRARDSSNAAYSSDVGNAIDPYLREILATLTPHQVSRAIGMIEPEDGRYWLAVGSYIFVLSYFPGSKISAWSVYTLDEIDGADVSDMIRADGLAYLRSGNTVYVYGGERGDTYPGDDEVTVTVKSPFMSAQAAATDKKQEAADFIGVNEWRVQLALNPNEEDELIDAGRIRKISVSRPQISVVGQSPVFAYELVNTRGGAATVSQIAIHFSRGAAG